MLVNPSWLLHQSNVDSRFRGNDGHVGYMQAKVFHNKCGSLPENPVENPPTHLCDQALGTACWKFAQQVRVLFHNDCGKSPV